MSRLKSFFISGDCIVFRYPNQILLVSFVFFNVEFRGINPNSWTMFSRRIFVFVRFKNLFIS